MKHRETTMPVAMKLIPHQDLLTSLSIFERYIIESDCAPNDHECDSPFREALNTKESRLQMTTEFMVTTKL